MRRWRSVQQWRLCSPVKQSMIRAITLFVALSGLSTAITVSADPPTAEQGDAMLSELKQIRQLLERQTSGTAARAPALPTEDKVSLQLSPGAYVLGSSDAPVTLVEYTDYECPFCRRFHVSAFEEIKRNYIDTGKVRFITRDFPLDMLHVNARRAAIAGRCAGEQGRFWELRHVMIVNANQLTLAKLVTYAQDLRLDVAAFRSCLESDKFRADIEREVAEARAIGITGTPSFVLARTAPGGLTGVRMVGAMPYGVFDAKLRNLLAEAQAK